MDHSTGVTVSNDPVKDKRTASKFNEGNNDIGNEAQVALGQPRDLPNLKRKLKSRHLQMIAIGESAKHSLTMTLFLIR